MNWMLMPYRRYFDFAGRSRRKEYWMFQLFIFIVYVVAMLLTGGLGMSMEYGDAGTMGPFTAIVLIALAIWGLASIIPSLALMIRRLHDVDKSGWWILIAFVPIIGGLILLYFCLIEGTRGDNRFGPDPKEGEARGV
ncbi:DUF805 domain-containing protein [Croceicoccus naphthovorans]|uniref:Uncharacterized protein n=1 Tax=Croceicoccus naphthovorans TaxID=1348774 RepID=A0A0G3XD56_9SPHN|nr:DUF805 domain-containing protein [Croceicoccus naphthovorans]AKM09515.1 hypothetical protein AB433_05215 [Croceicoccus naphthovorans]MBB3989743.1 uncharacterized membrane protein YhaH (DUF805 family) [Croceicoccus naphthovorans]